MNLSIGLYCFLCRDSQVISRLTDFVSSKNTQQYQAAISDKNCETHTPSPLIQCWLQVCLLICGLGCLAMLLQAWHNIESGGRGDSG